MNKFIPLMTFVFIVSSSIAVAQTNTFPASGNVGIGTTSPQSQLDIFTTGNTGLNLRTADYSTLISQFEGDWFGVSNPTIIQPGMPNNTSHPIVITPVQNAPTSGIVISSSGSVGIGTTAPRAKLDIGDTAGNGSLEAVFARLGEGNTSGDGTYLGVRSWATQPVAALGFSIEHHFYGETNSSINFYRGGDTRGGFITFATSNNTERMRVDATGNVGIGTTSPNAKLEVTGNIRLTSGSGASMTFADGTTQTTAWTGTVCGGDYAESVDVTGERNKYEPGDVLEIDSQNPNKFLKTTEPYSTGVAGVFSTKPGTVGRRQTTSKKGDEIPMAVVGIVPMKVSAENGAIRPRDLLVSSSTPGYAMKGTDRNRLMGAVIGKAMGTLNVGTGVIEVLVTLQ